MGPISCLSWRLYWFARNEKRSAGFPNMRYQRQFAELNDLSHSGVQHQPRTSSDT